MKRPFALSILFVCSIASAQGKYRAGQPNPADKNAADYTLKVHISSTHLRFCAYVAENGSCVSELYVDAILNGKKLELTGGVDRKTPPALIVPGDYLASTTVKPRAGGSPVFNQVYYVLLPNKFAWPCSITGLSE
jgi:hypothetical protein